MVYIDIWGPPIGYDKLGCLMTRSFLTFPDDTRSTDKVLTCMKLSDSMIQTIIFRMIYEGLRLQPSCQHRRLLDAQPGLAGTIGFETSPEPSTETWSRSLGVYIRIAECVVDRR